MPDEHAELLGGSSAARRYHCPASYRLEPGIPGHTSKAAERGTRLHAAVADLVTGAERLSEAFPEAYEAYKAFEKLCEGYAIETLMVERRVNPQLGFESFGTVDIIGIGPAHVLIVDWKFGYHQVEARDNYQLQYYAHATLQDERVKKLLPELYTVVMAIIQPQSSGNVVVSVAPSTEEELAATARVWKDNYIVRAAHEPVKGSWCQWCKAKPSCPAHIDTVTVSEFAKVNPHTIVSFGSLEQHVPEFDLRADNLGEQLTEWRRANELAGARVNALEQAVFAKVEAGESVPGWKLVAKRTSRHWIDAARAERLLRRKVGADVAAPRALISPPQAERVLGPDYRLLEKYVSRESSGVKLVPEEAAGDAINRGDIVQKLTGDK